ncbi:2-octaprenyl-6-methoxyphenyl hydroxylase [Marinobacterium sediminicola]|uniref:2-octaprenyl-6-methoxyphenol hydroxylase n=1 Tax=Marinobacterium sediminicola TaxID=518898 RepID=A0ABY1RZJ5_9GAMM|nr:2-octaprenyl-6-methoxyphenyl hydroxylase [Marinobacterium sediminicola]ULG69061.1 2-octaprenyl-6-methoxyphenyl hydroxylase [Marinobacterium sediminicola]SMR73682.1 2-octaprenyl-6-methoxyphenol hydroxylase [Marinobacterium sediminicola]
MQQYDLIIIGGGMVGASLAAALLPTAEALGLRMALVETQPLPEAGEPVFTPSYDARSTALAQGVRTLYGRMGIWSALESHLTPIDQIHVSDRGRFGCTRLHASEEGVPALGYVVENHWLGQVLISHLKQHAGQHLTLISPAEVEALTPTVQGHQARLKTAQGEQLLSAELVVMADGGRSALRERLGIHYREQAYGQHALVANVSLDRPHHNVAYERFTEAGPVALLPGESLNGKVRCGLVWTLSDDVLDEVLALDDADFLARLQDTFGYRAGRFTTVGERYHYPLKLTQAEEQVRSGLVLLGNAAHALHPIAGQGYNLALRGVVALADLVIARKRAGLPLGGLEGLSEFVEQRRQDQQRTIMFSDQTLKLFTSGNPLLRLGRGLGLQLLDSCPFSKTLFARAAMGLDQPAARLR